MCLNIFIYIHIGRVYFRFEGVDENELLLKQITSGQESEIIIGVDMNGHIWEMDGVENKNGKLIKKLAHKSRDG